MTTSTPTSVGDNMVCLASSDDGNNVNNKGDTLTSLSSLTVTPPPALLTTNYRLPPPNHIHGQPLLPPSNGVTNLNNNGHIIKKTGGNLATPV